MRDVVTGFYVSVLTRLLIEGVLSLTDRVLVVCGGPFDAHVMALIGFKDAVVTGLADAERQEDAEALSFDNGAFDVVIVHAGLHHCFSPHRALLEMYRVARKCVVAFESRDSLMIRT